MLRRDEMQYTIHYMIHDIIRDMTQAISHATVQEGAIINGLP